MKTCEECGDEIPKKERRHRCANCKKLVCGYCFGHSAHVSKRELENDELEPEECETAEVFIHAN